MRRKLLAWNLALAALLTAAGFELHRKWRDAREREERVLRQPPGSRPAPVGPAATPEQPVEAAAYLDVAERLLFARDRNPNVVIEEAPPKPQPPLPVAHGVMDLGSGPTALLSEKPGASQRGYLAGDRVGDYTLVSVSAVELVFEWEGRQIRKLVEELVDRGIADPAAAAAPASAPVPSAAAISTQLSAPVEAGPGVDMGGSMRACLPGDTSPAGTVSGGLRKIVTETPFGKACRWEPVR